MLVSEFGEFIESRESGGFKDSGESGCCGELTGGFGFLFRFSGLTDQLAERPSICV